MQCAGWVQGFRPAGRSDRTCVRTPQQSRRKAEAMDDIVYFRDKAMVVRACGNFYALQPPTRRAPRVKEMVADSS